MALGATHWNVSGTVRERARRVASFVPCSWNTYEGHGLPPARGEAFTVDFWAPPGRGAPLKEASGDAICSWVIGQHQVQPVRIVIWWGWVWTPGRGWVPYSGFQGTHGPGPDAHVHVGW